MFGFAPLRFKAAATVALAASILVSLLLIAGHDSALATSAVLTTPYSYIDDSAADTNGDGTVSNDVPDPFAPGVPSDLQAGFNLAAPHANFSQIVTLAPLASDLAPGPGRVEFSAATHPALGALVGRLSSDTTLSISNGPCNTSFSGASAITFTFLNGTVNTAATVKALPFAASNRLRNLARDDQVDNDGDGRFAEDPAGGGDEDGDGALDEDGADGPFDGIPLYADRYPSYLSQMFDPDFQGVGPGPDGKFDTPDDLTTNGPMAPIQPWNRYVGHTVVAGTNVVLQFLVFRPGDLAAFAALPNHFLSQFAGYMGWATVTVLQDPTGPPTASAIGDFCTPLGATAWTWGRTADNPCTRAPGDPGLAPLECPASPGPGPYTGNATTPGEANRVRATNPAAGRGILGTNTHEYLVYYLSLRDADNDGKENNLDTCATTADSLDPVNDTDLDEIANVCDAGADASATNKDGDWSDLDGDGVKDTLPPEPEWQNTLDNCPTIANNFQVDGEENVPFPADGGPRTDNIGIPCDSDPTTGNGHYHVILNVIPFCYKVAPSGGAFWCPETVTALGGSSTMVPEHRALHYRWKLHEDLSTADENAGGHCAALAVPSGKACDLSPATDSPAQSCTDGVDNDGDGATDTADTRCSTSVDADGDGWSDLLELQIGTDPRYACALSGHASGDAGFAGYHDYHPANVFGSDRTININDLVAVLGFFGTSLGGPGYLARMDVFDPGVTININDLVAVLGFFGVSCLAP